MADLDISKIISTSISVLPDLIKFAAALADMIGKAREGDDLRAVAARIIAHADEQIKALDEAVADDKAEEQAAFDRAAAAAEPELAGVLLPK